MHWSWYLVSFFFFSLPPFVCIRSHKDSRSLRLQCSVLTSISRRIRYLYEIFNFSFYSLPIGSVYSSFFSFIASVTKPHQSFFSFIVRLCCLFIIYYLFLFFGGGGGGFYFVLLLSTVFDHVTCRCWRSHARANKEYTDQWSELLCVSRFSALNLRWISFGNGSAVCDDELFLFYRIKRLDWSFLSSDDYLLLHILISSDIIMETSVFVVLGDVKLLDDLFCLFRLFSSHSFLTLSFVYILSWFFVLYTWSVFPGFGIWWNLVDCWITWISRDDLESYFVIWKSEHHYQF